MTPNQFFETIKPGCMDLWEKYQILPSVGAGQAALESGYGTSGLATKYNNLFGIKGAGQVLPTTEYYDGAYIEVKDSFRVYPNWATSILDYGDFLNVNPRYKAALGKNQSSLQIGAIAAAGYATDPLYAGKVNSIIATYRLGDWDGIVLRGEYPPKASEQKTITLKKGETLIIKGE